MEKIQSFLEHVIRKKSKPRFQYATASESLKTVWIPEPSCGKQESSPPPDTPSPDLQQTQEAFIWRDSLQQRTNKLRKKKILQKPAADVIPSKPSTYSLGSNRKESNTEDFENVLLEPFTNDSVVDSEVLSAHGKVKSEQLSNFELSVSVLEESLKKPVEENCSNNKSPALDKPSTTQTGLKKRPRSKGTNNNRSNKKRKQNEPKQPPKPTRKFRNPVPYSEKIEDDSKWFVFPSSKVQKKFYEGDDSKSSSIDNDCQTTIEQQEIAMETIETRLKKVVAHFAKLQESNLSIARRTLHANLWFASKE